MTLTLVVSKSHSRADLSANLQLQVVLSTFSITLKPHTRKTKNNPKPTFKINRLQIPHRLGFIPKTLATPWFKLAAIHLSFKEPWLFLMLRWREAWIFQILNWWIGARAGYEVFRTHPVRAEGGGFTKQSPIGYILIYPIKEPAGVWRQVQYPHTTGSYLRTSIFQTHRTGRFFASPF